MPSFPDSVFLFLLALLLFGPKRLPQLARELGKWVGEFRRASNEFKMQMQEELRVAEQEDRQRKIAAIEAAAPVAPHAATATPESQTTPPAPSFPSYEEAAAAEAAATSAASTETASLESPAPPSQPASSTAAADTASVIGPSSAGRATPIPIASSGDLTMMPPATGLPIAQSRPGATVAAPETHIANRTDAAPLSGLIESIPSTDAPAEPEAATHG